MSHLHRLKEAFRHQAKSCTDLGSPFMGQLLTLLAERLQPGSAVSDRLFDWPGDLSPSGHSVPLRLAGALHRLILNGQDRALATAYPPNQVNDDTLWNAVSLALETHCDDIQEWLNSPPQTNEVRRAAALIAAGHLLADEYALPMVVSELGASAGLNLNWDQFCLNLPGRIFGDATSDVMLSPDWSGNLPPLANVRVLERRGIDLTPIKITDPDHKARLMSYLWPDQPERMTLTMAAMEYPPAPVDKGDAINWLGARLAQPDEGALHLIYHTIAWQYFPSDTQDAGRRLIENAGNRATVRSPLAWLSMEADNEGPGAGLTLRTWPGGETRAVGRVDFHGRWFNWQL